LSWYRARIAHDRAIISQVPANKTSDGAQVWIKDFGAESGVQFLIAERFAEVAGCGAMHKCDGVNWTGKFTATLLVQFAAGQRPAGAGSGQKTGIVIFRGGSALWLTDLTRCATVPSHDVIE